MPAVSVILLAWNTGALLRPAVESILDQTMGDLELIIVDNGSVDGCVDQVLAARPDPRVRVLRHPTNLGIGAGTASGIAIATAPWIALNDADDRSHPMRLELQLQAARADPSLDLIGTGIEMIDLEDRPLGPWPAFYVPEEIKLYAPFGMPFGHPTLMGRADVFRAVPYRPEFDIVADFDFVVRASERFKIGMVSLPLYLYRRYAGSTTIGRMRQSEAYACTIRLVTARRRAGRPEQLAEAMAEVRALVAAQQNISDIYGYWSKRCLAEGFPLLAAFHSALEVRGRKSPGAVLRYVRHTLAALRADPGAWRWAIGAMGKAPFWMLLKRAGFPAFPRY
jgi:glycosyltransferase involved in cell wall biosynthesis